MNPGLRELALRSPGGGSETDPPPTEPSPDGLDWVFAEYDAPRCCFSATIEGALAAIYPNMVEHFDNKEDQDLELSVYTIKPRSVGGHWLGPTELTEQQLVWDAHYTQEWDQLSTSVRLTAPRKLRVKGTRLTPARQILPYNDSQYALTSVGPESYDWAWVE